MSDPRTLFPLAPVLGEVAYLAYWRALAPLALPWDRLTQAERRAWQASARAVLRAAADAGRAERRP